MVSALRCQRGAIEYVKSVSLESPDTTCGLAWPVSVSSAPLVTSLADCLFSDQRPPTPTSNCGLKWYVTSAKPAHSRYTESREAFSSAGPPKATGSGAYTCVGM